MTITPHLFEAFLKCPTKCWLRAAGEKATGNTYAEWVHTQNESYRTAESKRLITEALADRCAPSSGSRRGNEAPFSAAGLKSAKWHLAVDVLARSPELPPSRSSRGDEAQTSSTETNQSLLTSAATFVESRLHAIERIPSEGRGKASQVIPIRFIFRNKLTNDDRLLLAFDALVLSEILGREVSLGKIIHGYDHTTLKVKTLARFGEVRKCLEKIAALLSNPAPPDLVLNRHCAECEFQARCRTIAVEKDDLSLLAGMSTKERQELRSKGIFTITQLSYTFRPRRRPKHLRDKREKYHHALKALAIREKKIHIVGSPELKIEGTPVYLDVEGLPDRDFYYLIGVRIGDGESAVQHSLWADIVEDEGKIWREFLAILETAENPVLIHYGSYETTFLKEMNVRYGSPPEESTAARTIATAINVISVLFARVYFPTFANGLKDVARFLGFKWSEAEPDGLNSIMWRFGWEECKSMHFRDQLITYNAEDCQALEVLRGAVQALGTSEAADKSIERWQAGAVHVESIERKMPWGKFTSSIAELEQINNAAQWDYQRDRVYVRTGSKRIGGTAGRERNKPKPRVRVNKVIAYESEARCPRCRAPACRQTVTRSRIVRDLRFGTSAIKRWVIDYRFRYCWCGGCKLRFGLPPDLRVGMKYGWSFIAYVVYEIVDLRIPQTVIQRRLARLFGFELNLCTIAEFKARAAKYYAETRQTILERLIHGGVINVDETRANIKGKIGYVWIFANHQEVAYLYSDSREGEIAHATLADFKGVLVSDFYSAYDSFACPQQRCLIHLMRDLNDELLGRPFDEELRRIVMGFAGILKPMVETVDRHGLKKHFLKRHLKSTERLFRQIEKADFQSEAAVKCKDRFEKNRDRLFTFLDHDGVPWNNNSAEHAVKAFAALRDVMRGSSTRKGLEDYLILLSVCQTCKYMGVDFLDFLRSGEKDIHAFAESRHGRRRRTRSSERDDLPANANPDRGG